MDFLITLLYDFGLEPQNGIVMKPLTVSLLFTFIAFCNPISTFACSCTEYNIPYCEQIARADAIFIGTVNAVDLKKESSETLVESKVSFNIEQIFKGTLGSKADIGYVFGTSCSWLKFEEGDRWIVYGYKNSSNGRLSIPFCTGSHQYESTSPDLTILNNFSLGKGTESIRGRIASDGNVTNNRIVISDETTNLTTKTDDEGLFEISVPRPGKYKVKVTVPFSAILMNHDPSFQLSDVLVNETESSLTYEAKVEKGLCSYKQLDFSKVDLKANASISGRLIDSNGNPTKGFLHLQKWSSDEPSTLKGGEFASANEDGTYSFDGLREGRYVIVLNPEDFPRKSDPYLRTYLPGVAKFDSAFVIDLEQGKEVNAPDFKVPKKIKQRTIQIEALWPDGKPVTNWGPKAKPDSMPSVTLYRADGKYVELAELSRTGNGLYSFVIYDGFPYVIKFESFGSDDRQWNAYSKIPSRGIPKTIKVILSQKYRDVSDFLDSLNTDAKGSK